MKFDGTIGVYGTFSTQELQLRIKERPYNWKLIVHQEPDYAKEATAHEPLCEYIEQNRISSEDFITHEFSFEMIEKGFENIRRFSWEKCVRETMEVLLN